MKFKTTMLGVGSFAVIAVPLITVVSCGKSNPKKTKEYFQKVGNLYIRNGERAIKPNIPNTDIDKETYSLTKVDESKFSYIKQLKVGGNQEIKGDVYSFKRGKEMTPGLNVLISRGQDISVSDDPSFYNSITSKLSPEGKKTNNFILISYDRGTDDNSPDSNFIYNGILAFVKDQNTLTIIGIMGKMK